MKLEINEVYATESTILVHITMVRSYLCSEDVYYDTKRRTYREDGTAISNDSSFNIKSVHEWE